MDIKLIQVYASHIKSSISSKLRNFQYKFLTRIIPTNKWLYKCKLVNSCLCNFCNMYVDSLVHLFWECHLVQNFWRDLQFFLNSKGLNVNLNYEIISFGVLNKVKFQDVKNFIIFSAKYYIFINKCNKMIPNIINYKEYLKKTNYC